MIEINLLPKEFQKKGFSLSLDKNLVYALGGAVLLIILMAAVSIYQNIQLGKIEKKIEIVQAKNDAYGDEIAQIDELNRLKNQILSRIAAIDALDKNRTYWTTVLSDLTAHVPAHVWLTTIKEAGAGDESEMPKVKGLPLEDKKRQEENRTVLEGYTFSLNALAAFLIQLNRSEYFDNLEISSINLEQVESKKVVYNFKIKCDLTDYLGIRNKKEAGVPEKS